MGIGKALAIECARRGMNLLIVALPDEELERTVREIKAQYPVEVKAFGADLTDPAGTRRIAAYCFEERLPVSMLINNAGFGAGGLFENNSLKRYHSMQALNNRAMVDLCYLLLPVLKKHCPAFIMNTSSVEATLPLPYKTVYTGTKSFIYSFSLALNEELRSSDISVSVLCPGPVVTNQEGLVRLNEYGWKGRLIAKMPDEVAAVAIKALLKRRRVIVPGRVNRLYIAILYWFPLVLKMRLLERMFRVYRSHNMPAGSGGTAERVHAVGDRAEK